MDHETLLEFLRLAVGVTGVVLAVLAYGLVRRAAAIGSEVVMPGAVMALALAFVLAAALFPWRGTPDLSPEIIHLRGALHILRGSATDELTRIARCVDGLAAADAPVDARHCAADAKALLIDLGNDLQVVGGNVADVGCLLVKVSDEKSKGGCP